ISIRVSYKETLGHWDAPTALNAYRHTQLRNWRYMRYTPSPTHKRCPQRRHVYRLEAVQPSHGIPGQGKAQTMNAVDRFMLENRIPGNPGTYLSVGDAAAETGIPREEIVLALDRHELPHKRFTYSGWRWIKRFDLYAWMEDRS